MKTPAGTSANSIFRRSLAIAKELCDEGAHDAIGTATIILAMCMRRFMKPERYAVAVDEIAEKLKGMPEGIPSLGRPGE